MIDRDKLKEEFNQLRLEQSNISSRIKHINWALSSTTDQLAELYLRNDIILSTKTTIKGIVHVLFDLKSDQVYLVEGRSIYNGILRLKSIISYKDYVELEKHKDNLNVIDRN